VPLLVGEQRFGVLTVYADPPQVLDAEAELAATALGLHVAVALRRLSELNGLEEAVSARQLVGQAVGILAERHRLTPEEAFSRLVRWSQHRNVKLRSIARTLVETGQEPPPLPGP
jgi:AmiR/NasT family two-component response regulator